MDEVKSVEPAKEKRKRAKRKFADKGIDAFRAALVQHVTNARLVASTTPLNDASTDPAAIPLVGEDERRQWLAEYKAKIANYDVQQLVQESVRYRFQCSPYVIIVPNWHGLREALWVHMKNVGVHKAKRTVSTKDDLIELCIDETIQFDFSDYAKDALSHGNKKSQQELKQQRLEQSKKLEALAAGQPLPLPHPPPPPPPPPPATLEQQPHVDSSTEASHPAPPTPASPPVTLKIEQGGSASAISSLPRRPLQPATAETVINTIKTLSQQEQQQFNAWYQNVWLPQQQQRHTQHEHQQHHIPPSHSSLHAAHPHQHPHNHTHHAPPPPPQQPTLPIPHNIPLPLPPPPPHQPPLPHQPSPHQTHHVQLQSTAR